MNAVIVTLLFWLGVLGMLCPVVYWAFPAVLPTQRGIAARRVSALQSWDRKHNVAKLCSKAEGYFNMRDYIGVESAYLNGRRIVDGGETERR